MAAVAPPLPPLTREQKLITVGLMAALAVAALDSTVVGTAMPTIIGQLGGLSEYAWVFSAYLLASTTTVPLYAKLADMHGRKPVFLFGLGLFVARQVVEDHHGTITWQRDNNLTCFTVEIPRRKS